MVGDRRFLFFCVCIVLTAALVAQQQDGIGVDSTVTPDIDSSNTNVLLERQKKTDSFYDTLQNRAGNRSISKGLYDLLVKENSTGKDIKGKDREDYYHFYVNRRINDIYIKRLKPFGASVSDTNYGELNFFQRIGNNAHITTRERVIVNRLTFKIGDLVEPVNIADNERLLRTLPYIQDARIYIEPVEDEEQVANIFIVVEDVMPYAAGWEAYDVGFGNAGIWNNNIFGLGHELRFDVWYNINKKPETTYIVNYRINNISNTQIASSVYYENTWERNIKSLSLNRNFLIPEIKYGGGFDFENAKRVVTPTTIDSIYPTTHYYYNYSNFWLGRSFQIMKYKNLFTRTKLYFSARAFNYNFLHRPEVQEDLFYRYHNRTTFLASVGIAEEGFVKSKFVYGFGITEDIPYGTNVSLTLGHELGEFKNRNYLGFTVASGAYYPGIGYLYSSAALGGYFKDDIEHGAISFKARYYSPLVGFTMHRFRFYTTLKYSSGINQNRDEYLVLRKNDGVRGLWTNDIRANQEFYLNTEVAMYAPHLLYGFRFVYYAFGDIGFLDSDTPNLFENPVYSSVGIGLRVRNERLVFNTLQIRLAYFPFAPEGVLTENFYITGAGRYQPEDFSPRPPEITTFGVYR